MRMPPCECLVLSENGFYGLGQNPHVALAALVLATPNTDLGHIDLYSCTHPAIWTIKPELDGEIKVKASFTELHDPMPSVLANRYDSVSDLIEQTKDWVANDDEEL